jgi:hypothetical protein
VLVVHWRGYLHRVRTKLECPWIWKQNFKALNVLGFVKSLNFSCFSFWIFSEIVWHWIDFACSYLTKLFETDTWPWMSLKSLWIWLFLTCTNPIYICRCPLHPGFWLSQNQWSDYKYAYLYGGGGRGGIGGIQIRRSARIWSKIRDPIMVLSKFESAKSSTMKSQSRNRTKLQAKSTIRAKVLDKSAIRCINKIRKFV